MRIASVKVLSIEVSFCDGISHTGVGELLTAVIEYLITTYYERLICRRAIVYQDPIGSKAMRLFDCEIVNRLLSGWGHQESHPSFHF